MNNAELGEDIDEYMQDVDGQQSKADAERQSVIGADPAVHLDPSRWWFASSAFPMIAGTLGPVASAFSICALVKQWRMYIPPGWDVSRAEFVPDPPWLTGINAAQLVIALIANLFLLLNMARRVRFSIAQPITIVGWYISSILLVALAATAAGPLVEQPQIDFVWSQAFYYGIFAAVLYFAVATLMAVTAWGAQAGHYEKDFGLTTSQRTLMLQTILFLMYLLLGALVFSHIENWQYLDTVYWADVTLFTVGYGDYSPSTTLGRALLIPYALIGVTSLGLVIGSIRSLVLDRGKRRLDARMLENKRRQYLRRLRRRGKDGILRPIDSNSQENDLDWDSSKQPRTELERREKEFQLMRKIQKRASTRRRWMALAISSSTWIVLWLVGAKIFQESEAPYQSWTYFDAFYFAFTGLTTIGYGDLTPVSPCGKAFFVFWSLLALPTMTVLISNAGDTLVKWVRDGTLKLGNLTILPGEQGFKKEIKMVLGKLSFGAVFSDVDIEESPPGFFGAAHGMEEEEEDEEDGDVDSEGEFDANEPNVHGSSSFRKKTGQEQAYDEPQDPKGPLKRDTNNTYKSGKSITLADPPARPTRESPAASPTDKPNTKERNRSKSKERPRTASTHNSTKDEKINAPRRAETIAREDLPTELPKSRAEYHLVLIDEIARVTQHLQHSPPRQYTFKEWAWYLRLIGEDESSSETHRKPERKPNTADGRNVSRVATHKTTRSPTDEPYSPVDGKGGEGSSTSEGGGGETDHAVIKWSWVGHRSPLMDTKEEAEWILDRLEQKLKAELKTIVSEQLGKQGTQDVKIEEARHEVEQSQKHEPLEIGH
ncbi:putative Potassium channel domain-containing protein [Seiridium unicorne]|uniref:Potassium channel domain-containing protein n=1 Tax=Seiridium unicorne TaxID=138068 RepID=A0ABR2VE24_9PEZI